MGLMYILIVEAIDIKTDIIINRGYVQYLRGKIIVTSPHKSHACKFTHKRHIRLPDIYKNSKKKSIDMKIKYNLKFEKVS